MKTQKKQPKMQPTKLFDESDNIAALYFNLSTYDGRQNLKQALAGSNAAVAFHEIDTEVFRKRIKYGGDEITEEQYKLLETLRSEVNAIILEWCPELLD